MTDIDQHEINLSAECTGIWLECSCGELRFNMGIPKVSDVSAAASFHLAGLL